MSETFAGVPGKYSDTLIRDGLYKKQTFTTAWRSMTYYGDRAMIRATIRFDDECNNKHETFAITGEIVKRSSNGEPMSGDRNWLAGGCCHDEIAKKFPELAHLIKWHLTSSDGPMHYIANTVYHASDRDHNGLLKGEKRQIINGKSGLPSWKLTAVNEAGEEVSSSDLPKYFDGETPPETSFALKWLPWCRIGEGKERNLDAARSSAVWPEATDAELMAEPEILKAKLIERHAALMASFKAEITAAGFKWTPEPVEA